MAPGAVVVGTGFGCRVHVPALRAAGFDVKALVGRDPARTERRAERLGVPRACTSLTDALALDGVDAVTIATPPDTHAALAIEAARTGRHVVCEKPFALDGDEAREMLAAAEHAGVTHLVGHEFRWSPARAAVARAITRGAIGTPKLCTLVQLIPFVADPEARVPRWWFDGARGGGWLGASGSHVVDQVRTWFGDVAHVSATLPTVAARDSDLAEDSFVVRLRTRAGVDVVVVQSAAAWTAAANVTVVAGTYATVGIDGDEPWIADRDGRRPLPVPDAFALPGAAPDESDTRERFTHLELGPYTRLCEALRAGVEGRAIESAVPVPTFADGVACMDVLDAIRASAVANGTLVAVRT